MATVRMLNGSGIRHFRAWLEGGAQGDVPMDLLSDPATSESLSGAGSVEREAFASRYELGRHVLAALKNCDFNRISYAEGLWDWLTLFYIDLLCPNDRLGRRTVFEISRYILMPEYRQYYRHLIREAVVQVRRNGEYARAMLFSRAGLHGIGTIFEQVAARQDLISNPAVVELVWRLYFNPKRKTPKAGVAGTHRPGGIRRFALVLQQLSLNYDLPGMTAQEIGGLLPSEFDTWRRRANWSALEPEATAGVPAGKPRVRFDGIVAGSEWRPGPLAELWGYRGPEALNRPLLAPRGLGALVLFVGPTERWEVNPKEGTVAWSGDAAHRVDKRLTVAVGESRPVHVFRRPEPRRPFVYVGPCRVLAHSLRTDAPSEFVFGLKTAVGESAPPV